MPMQMREIQQLLHQVILFVLLVTVFVIVGCSQTNRQKALSLDNAACERLAAELDKIIYETQGTMLEQNGDSLIVLGLQPNSVGGRLTEISHPWFYNQKDEEQGMLTYRLTLEGEQKIGDLLVRIPEEQALPYEVGTFYQFDATATKEDIRHLGTFNDLELNRLHAASC
ncbi:hypothetical protein HYW21_00765 [Candidatus Woesearchaeota archaeon]|nr:hypothetical protein [Candidatus Woesearchaeota archaeon]